MTSNVACDDHYVSSIVLENSKDRSITIFGIYLKIGHGYYIELENFQAKPMILKAFESYHKEYGPIQFYGSNGTKVDLKKSFLDRSQRQRLVLSASDGKYTVPKFIHAWNPVTEYFKNLNTIIITPVMLKHREEYIGSKIDYVVELEAPNGHKDVVQLAKDSFRYSVFKDFTLTEESLRNAASLKAFLGNQLVARKEVGYKITVFEPATWKTEVDEKYSSKIEAGPTSWFSYFVVGRFLTWLGARLDRFRL